DREGQVRRRHRRRRRSGRRHHAAETRHVRDEGRKGGGAMTRRYVLASCTFVGFCVFVVSSLSAAGPACDLACLRTVMDAYLNAVVKHDPVAAPLAIGFRQTENAVVVRDGTGVWKSVTALGAMQRRYLDPVSGQAAYFGVVEEGAEKAVV